MKFTEEEIAVAMILHRRRREKAHAKSIFFTVPLPELSQEQLRHEAIADLTEQDEPANPAEGKE